MQDRVPGLARLSAVPDDRTVLAAESPGATISVGFAERGEQDTLEGLIARADQALIGTRTRSSVSD